MPNDFQQPLTQWFLTGKHASQGGVNEFPGDASPHAPHHGI